MQQTSQARAKGEAAGGMGEAAVPMGPLRGSEGEKRKRVETLVETLARMRGVGETLSEVAHDARNMVTALGLYCDLLEEPGVLAAPYAHYGQELRLVAAASRRLVEKVVALDARSVPAVGPSGSDRAEWGRQPTASGVAPGPDPALDRDSRPGPAGAANRNRRWDLLPAVPVANLAAELLANRNLLAALAGPSIGLTIDADGGAQPVRLTGEDLTRILVNLVKNAAEAMPGGGRISIGLSERPAAQGAAASVALTVEDNGPGIPDEELEAIFASGYTTRRGDREEGNWTPFHRGLGLAITRAIIEGAGGRIAAGNREQGGARFEIELPVRNAGR
ncbi:MAG: sensor histidine kinase [Terracidiphilus sp.]